MDAGTALSGAGLGLSLTGAAAAAWRRLNSKIGGHETRIAVVEANQTNMGHALDEIKDQNGKIADKLDRLTEHLLEKK